MKQALIASIIFHTLCFSFFLFTPSTHNKPQKIVMSTNILFKEKKTNKDHLPKKKQPAVVPKLKKVKKVKVNKKPQPSKKYVDYSKELASLSDGFLADLKEDEVILNQEEPVDNNYFSQVYALIKASFIVPSHINGIKGQKIKAQLRIFLHPDGQLKNVLLESSSGDEHFDKAIIHGAKRVHNFGLVPLSLRESLTRDGILVEMCPFRCF